MLEIPRADFVRAVELCAKVADSKLAGADHILLSSGCMFAVSETASVKVKLPLPMDHEALAMKADVLAQHSSFVDADIVRIEVTTKVNARIHGGSSRFTVPCLPPEDFPELDLPPVEGQGISAPELAEALKFAAPAVYPGDDRPNLGGVHLKLADGQLHAEATDGCLMHRATIPVESDVGWSTIVHRSGVWLLQHLCEQEAVVSIGAHYGNLYVAAGGTWARIQRVEDAYPDLDRLPCPDTGHQAHMDRRELQTALKHMMCFYDRKMSVPYVQLDPSAQQLCLQTTKGAGSQGEHHVSLESGPTCDGNTVDLERLTRSVAAFRADTVTFTWDPAGRGQCLKITSKDLPGKRAVVVGAQL